MKPLGDGWVAFSPASGDTMLLNDESAAILEILADTPCDWSAVCAVLAQDTGLSPDEIDATAGDAWARLVEAGLIRSAPDVDSFPAGRCPA